ncbi:hypothetical protein B0T17DRAFT_13173 [Bombardia bombarda]|uniref:Uncharacterized protein n=1 Tax=Bombardia bombarda TaxID=252184 RepID=A0AA39XIJ4_9PEZI|nr:hypothetical protein B0T17DRAFT_13173 [Bombardia bombarda]
MPPPQIPVPMAGGRPRPGSAARQTPKPRSTTPWSPRSPTPFAMGTPTLTTTTEQQQDRGLDFGSGQFDNAQFFGHSLDSPKTAPSPTKLRALRQQQNYVEPKGIAVKTTFEALRYCYQQKAFIPNSGTDSKLPLYGMAYVNDHGKVEFDSSRRMKSWLSGIYMSNMGLKQGPSVPPWQEPSRLQDHDVDASMEVDAKMEVDERMEAAEEAGTSTATIDHVSSSLSPPHNESTQRKRQQRTEQRPQTGMKRPADSDDNNSSVENHMQQPPSKRSRFSATFRQTFSRMSHHHRNSRQGDFKRSSVQSAVDEGDGGIRDAFSRLSFFNKGATAVRASGVVRCYGAGDGSTAMVEGRRIKVCLIGDRGSGKTALVNRLVSGEYSETVPSSKIDCRSFNIVTDNGELVIVEVWDFPANVGNELVSAFFQAAIICYSVEDEDNVKAVTRFWKPKLENSLIDCPLFVLGLKKDLRPNFPTLGLSFLPEKEPASTTLGRNIAKEAHAQGFGECSAKTGDNVQAAVGGIVEFVVDRLRDSERERSRDQRHDKAKSAVAAARRKVSDGYSAAVAAVASVGKRTVSGETTASRAESRLA